MNRQKRRRLEEAVVKWIMRGSLLIVVAVLGMIVVSITVKGMGALSWQMLTQPPQGGFYLGKEGGILNAITGSLLLALGATLLALVLAVPVVIFLHAYTGHSRMVTIVRLALDVLWGIPSIVYGAFGFTLMLLMGLRASLLGGIIALALVELPILARTMDEVLRMIPAELKETTRALGTTRLELAAILLRQTIPGLVTAILLGFGRGIGDAASVLFTAGYTDNMPQSLLRPVASLPLAVFFQLNTPLPEVQERAYASALVLMVLVLVISLLARLSMKALGKYVIR
ncbi:MAG: ABC transporter permease subunit [Anaerolineae bacterium]|nr:ABC transporter permease subunit [Anaerolineae bacterium]